MKSLSSFLSIPIYGITNDIPNDVSNLYKNSMTNLFQATSTIKLTYRIILDSSRRQKFFSSQRLTLFSYISSPLSPTTTFPKHVSHLRRVHSLLHPPIYTNRPAQKRIISTVTAKGDVLRPNARPWRNVESIWASTPATPSSPPSRVATAAYLSKGAKYLVPIVSAGSYPLPPPIYRRADLTTLVYVYGSGFDDRVCTNITYVVTTRRKASI